MPGNKVLHHRTGWNGQQGVHTAHTGGSSSSHHFNSTFLSQCGNWANAMNIWLWSYAGSTSLSWVGEIGAGLCKTGMHGQARALDISRVSYANGQFIDTNWSWRPAQALLHRRRYVALAASLRYYFATVITFGYTPDLSHENHIHADNGAAMQPLNTGWLTDTLIVQMACNYLNSAGIAIDGAWGPNTENAYQALRTRFNMGCYDPKTNLQHARNFLTFIVAHGLTNQAAGAIRANC